MKPISKEVSGFDKNKTWALLYTVLIYLLAIGIYWLIEYLPGFEAWQKELFGSSFLGPLIVFLVLPAIAVLLDRSCSGSTYTSYLTLSSLTYALKVGGRSLNVMMPLTFLSFPFVMWLGYSFYGWTGAAIISGWHILALPLIAWLLRGFDRDAADYYTMRDVFLLFMIIVISSAMIYALHFWKEWAANLIMAWIYIGFAEEFFFRGYIQGKLNRAFGKNYSFIGIAVGPGLFIAALLFGLAHVLTPGQPFQWPWAIWTFFAGLCFGLIREKGGGFLASAFVHALIMSFYVMFGS
ncbi:MAG: CPBP family intramembrane metalloprotease [Bacteroidetes bacterium]|jgi:membrane protease YdiL (CAAX protease family)|nr:CPBP family intramembrane metalloprotease [Bacteroidota bacterium]